MNEDLRFEKLVEALDRLERISARTQMTVILVNLLRETPPSVIDKVIYLIQGKLGPDWKDIPNLGVSEKFLVKAISLAYKTPEKRVDSLYKQLGDLGKVAETLARESESKQAGAPTGGILSWAGEASRKELTVSYVYNTLYRIAMAQGEGSRDIKIRLISGLLSEAHPLEARYIVRIIEGRLRLGVGDATVLDALAIAFGEGVKDRPIVERAYNLRADLGHIAKICASQGVSVLENVKPEVGIPIRPMLAERLSDPVEILSKIGGRGIVEYKYDGERGQIHKKGSEVRIYSRRLENISRMYPDVRDLARSRIKAEEAIIEGEIVAVDPETMELRPFQELMRRKRKHDIHIAMKEVPVAVFLFDALYVNGEDLTVKTLPERRKALESIIEPSNEWSVATYIETDDPDEFMNFFMQAVSEGAEGVMAKAVHEESIYRAGARGWLWIKFKRDYKSEMTDTVDLAVVGAFYGRGRRGGKLGTLLMAAYDPQTDTFKTVCKVGSGFTDEDLDNMYSLLEPYIIDHKHPRVDSMVKPDIWVTPAKVAEIIGAELTLSPLHTCCRDKIRRGAGISIRFPRFIRWRDDKGPEDATTTDELLEMYQRQLKRIEETQ